MQFLKVEKLNHMHISELGSKFESYLEDFYGTCDQIEVVLKCAIESQKLAQSSSRYMQIQPVPSKLECTAQNSEEFLSYPQYIAVAKQQISYANSIREMIRQATTDVVEQVGQTLFFNFFCHLAIA